MKAVYPNNPDQKSVDELEQAFITTIGEFSVYVGSITADLETKETERNKARLKAGRNPRNRWNGSTLKVDVVSELVFTLFTPSRLLMYNVVILFPMKKWIDARNELFFLKAQVFPGAPEEDIKFFRDLWSVKDAMVDTEKNIIWGYWDTLNGIAEDWQALTGWVAKPEDKLDIPEIDYEEEAKRIGI
tara:strand:- start:71863 stop:72423 length:561 start_codon:yes stop_codon:yes gene_type:complete